MEYEEFLQKKSHSINNFGFEAKYNPEYLFDFQSFIVKKGIKKGRYAIFADTGLGKTAIELVIAENIVRETNKKVLIITPIAVAYQFLLEAEKIGVDDVTHSKVGELKSKIIVTNYERLHYYNPNDFVCVICDESSILKNDQGVIRSQVTSFMKRHDYRFLATATPSPNDFIELGTSSEALGNLGYMDMLKIYFGNNENNIRPQEIANKWYLKPHAIDAFFNWVSSWSIVVRKPSDLGFDDTNYKLPNLIKNHHSVKNECNWLVNGQTTLYGTIAQTMTDVKEEQKQTIKQRCELAYELSSQHEVSVYWCNFNKEGDLLKQLDKDAYQIQGGMDIDKKEELLENFFKGNINKLITKPKMTAYGLNWQRCNHTTYFPTWSYEQYYQAIRRFWRFGQKKDVIVDLIYSDGQKRVLDALELKSQKADELFEKLNKNTNEVINFKKLSFDKQIVLPSFIG